MKITIIALCILLTNVSAQAVDFKLPINFTQLNSSKIEMNLSSKQLRTMARQSGEKIIMCSLGKSDILILENLLRSEKEYKSFKRDFEKNLDAEVKKEVARKTVEELRYLDHDISQNIIWQRSVHEQYRTLFNDMEREANEYCEYCAKKVGQLNSTPIVDDLVSAKRGLVVYGGTKERISLRTWFKKEYRPGAHALVLGDNNCIKAQSMEDLEARSHLLSSSSICHSFQVYFDFSRSTADLSATKIYQLQKQLLKLGYRTSLE